MPYRDIPPVAAALYVPSADCDVPIATPYPPGVRSVLDTVTEGSGVVQRWSVPVLSVKDHRNDTVPSGTSRSSKDRPSPVSRTRTSEVSAMSP